ncbi:MAG: SPW repeat protein [Patescibacteria group bacterium]
MWQQWVNGILGIWVLLVPFLGFTPEALTSVLVVTGLVIAILGFWGAAEHRRM